MRRIILALLVAAIAAATTVPLAASADRNEELVIGVRVNFANQSEGTFDACCAVNDSGTARADVTSFTPKRNDMADFEAIETFTGSQGTFRLALRGTTGPLSSPRHIARGRWRVIDGTGAYADLEGRGRFTAVTNQATGALTAINKGEADDD